MGMRIWTARRGVLGAALLLAVGVLSALWAAGPAGATLPGGNGKIVYANGGIWVAGPGGENPVRLTSSIMDADPSWSPDGDEIVFSRSYEAEVPRAYFVDADGVLGEVAYPNARGFEPAWAPDGRRSACRATPGNALTSVTVTGDATPLGTTGAAPDWQTAPNTRPTISAPKPAPDSKVRDATPS